MTVPVTVGVTVPVTVHATVDDELTWLTCEVNSSAMTSKI